MVDRRDAAPAASTHRTGTGPGRLLVAVYGVFAISAFARAAYQIGTKFSAAPLAYALSALSAVVYLLAAVAMGKGGPAWWRIALGAVIFEAVGVIAVGALTTFDASLFADETVWSGFGAGYGYVPLVLPFVGLFWIARNRDHSFGPGR